MATLSKIRGSITGWAAALLIIAATNVMAEPIVVNCDQGQSLNRTIAKLPKQLPTTVWVKGTCTEYVTVYGFEGLTLKGLSGATLQQPGTTPASGVVAPLLIGASRSITVDGFTVHSVASALSAIGVGQSSMDVRLRDLTVAGAAAFGIAIFEESQVSLARVTARDPGFAALAALDVSDVHVEQCLLDHSTTSWNEGLFVGSGHVTIQNTTIRNMQVGIDIQNHGSVDIQSFNTYYPVSANHDVVIDNPAGNNFQGAKVAGGSALNIGDTKLRILNAGQPGGGNNAAVWISEVSTLGDPNGNLVIVGSRSQGLLVSNNSHASLAGSSITGRGRGGLVVTNLSTISVRTYGTLTQVSGNQTDLYCDPQSLITGTTGITGVGTITCNNLVPGDWIPLP
jgi:hypothetical protein